MGYQTLLEVDTEEELFRRPFTEQELLHLPRLVPEDSRFACCKGGGNIHIGSPQLDLMTPSHEYSPNLPY